MTNVFTKSNLIHSIVDISTFPVPFSMYLIIFYSTLFIYSETERETHSMVVEEHRERERENLQQTLS